MDNPNKAWRRVMPAEILCPFYLSHTPSSVRCEAPEKDCTAALIYPSVRGDVAPGLWKRLARYCAADYQSCHHYRMLMREKYND